MIQPTYGTLLSLFSDRVFRIPRYQRFYSWKKKQRIDLFQDIRKLSDRNDDNHHFMATVVCHRTDEVTPIGSKEYRLYDVVDGQQRLTTLIILLKTIEIQLPTDPAEEERADLRKLLVKGDGNLILLQTNNSNEHIFNKFLREGTEPTAEQIETNADKNLQDAIRDCAKFVSEWNSVNDPLRLLRLLLNRLGFVFYDTEDKRVVYTIFEVLNSRGLAVDWLDKCKSVLMEQAFEHSASHEAADAAVESLKNLWGNIYRTIAKGSLDGEEILRVTATLHYGNERGKPLGADASLESLRSDCDSADKPRQLTERIADIAQKLSIIENNKFLGPVTEILHARILAVAILATEVMTETEKQKALSQWERVTFRIFGLSQKDARTKVGDYVRLASKIINKAAGGSRYSEIMDSIKSIGDDFPITKIVDEELINSNLYENSPRLCRYMLWKYEEHLANEAGRSATVDENTRRDIWNLRATDSVEHIFPQNPERGGAWDGKVSPTLSDEEYWRTIGCIGNLILLPITLNEEAKRKGFAEKKSIYDKHALRMVKEITEADDWTSAEIADRERRIAEWAKTEWSDIS